MFSLKKIIRSIGASITIVGTVISIAVYFGDPNPKLGYKIMSQALYFNNSQTISIKKVYYDSLDVQKNNLNISVYTVMVVNEGEHMAPSDYDDGDFGLTVQNGRVIETLSIGETATEHIKTRLEDYFRSYKNDSAAIHIPKMALDKDEYYVIKFEVIHSNNSYPKLSCIGKIVGQKQIDIQSIDDEESMLSAPFKGSRITHALRLIVYGLAFIAFIVVALVLLGLIAHIRELITRRTIRKKTETVKNNIISRPDIHQTVKEELNTSELSWLMHIRHLLDKLSPIIETNPNIYKVLSTLENSSSKLVDKHNLADIIYCGSCILVRDINLEISLSKLNGLIERKYILKDHKGNCRINPELKESLDKVYEIYISEFPSDKENKSERVAKSGI